MTHTTQTDPVAVRRLVTGVGPEGRSALLADGGVEPLCLPGRGTMLHRVWGADAVPSLPYDGSPPPQLGHLPLPGGVTFAILTLPPVDQDGADDEPLHVTDTVDLVVVLAGEVVLVLPDGEEHTLAEGDTVVQAGAEHLWRNRSAAAARLAVVAIGAERAEAAP